MDTPISRLKTLCEAEAAEIVAEFSLSHYRGGDWCMITEEEGEALGIALAEMPMVAAAYEAYLILADTASRPPFPEELIDALQAELTWIRPGIVEPEAFIRLAELLGVRPGAAQAFYDKQTVALLGVARRIELLPSVSSAHADLAPPTAASDLAEEDDDIPF